nr:hypothetical protein [uncultured Caproiciproducens sp.]
MSEKMVEYIAKSCDIYISNIRLSANSTVILPIIQNMDPNLFSAEDWSTSLSYIFMKPLLFKTSVAAKDYYVKELLKKFKDDSHM